MSLRARSTRGWINAGFSVPFAVKRFALMLLLSHAPLLLFIHVGWEPVGLLAMLPGIWPYRFRFSSEHDGLRVRWLWLAERIPWAAIEGAELSLDPRWFVPGRPGCFLRIMQRGGRAALIDAPGPLLERLLNDVRARLQTSWSEQDVTLDVRP